jgi:hypothetical protein
MNSEKPPALACLVTVAARLLIGVLSPNVLEITDSGYDV